MGTTAVILLGIFAWVVLAAVVGLVVGRMIRLRDRQRPGGTEPGLPTEVEPGSPSLFSRITGDAEGASKS